MSFNEEEEEQRNEEVEDQDNLFDFYLRCTKKLVLELPSAEDKAMASAWIQRLESSDIPEEERLRVDYLKLLLFVMQRGRLIGIFRKEPPTEALEPFPQSLGLAEMGNLLLEQAELQGSGDADGVFYAWSMDDPIHKWSLFDEDKFPQYVRDKIRQLKAINSEEKTNLQSMSQLRGKSDDPLRRCDSSYRDKHRTKVKSPQEIKMSQERSYHTYMNYVQRGSGMKDKCGDDDRNWKKTRPSKKSTPDCSGQSSMKMDRDSNGSRFCGKSAHLSRSATNGVDMRGDDAEECMAQEDMDGMPEGARGAWSNARRERSGHSGQCNCTAPARKQDCDTSKRLQKCDAEEGGMRNDPCSAGPSNRPRDRYGGQGYRDFETCSSDQMAEKPCVCPRGGYNMSQGASQSPAKSPKQRCPPGNRGGPTPPPPGRKCRHANEDSINLIEFSCDECKLEKDSSQSCNRKKDKPAMERPCPKSKITCPEGGAARRTQECPCPPENGPHLSDSRRDQVPTEQQDNRSCKANTRVQELKNLSNIGPKKAGAMPCGQENGIQPPIPSWAKHTRRRLSDRRDGGCMKANDEFPPFCNDSPRTTGRVGNSHAALESLKNTLENHRELCGAAQEIINKYCGNMKSGCSEDPRLTPMAKLPPSLASSPCPGYSPDGGKSQDSSCPKRLESPMGYYKQTPPGGDQLREGVDDCPGRYGKKDLGCSNLEDQYEGYRGEEYPEDNADNYSDNCENAAEDPVGQDNCNDGCPENAGWDGGINEDFCEDANGECQAQPSRRMTHSERRNYPDPQFSERHRFTDGPAVSTPLRSGVPPPLDFPGSPIKQHAQMYNVTEVEDDDSWVLCRKVGRGMQQSKQYVYPGRREREPEYLNKHDPAPRSQNSPQTFATLPDAEYKSNEEVKMSNLSAEGSEMKWLPIGGQNCSGQRRM